MTADAKANGQARTTATAPPPAQKKGEFPGSAPWGDISQASAYEDQIREEARAVWADDGDGSPDMTRALFLKLEPLLRRPLHPGHIMHTTAGKGKPYASDGARSVQVLIDRMNNVLTPLWWADRVEYHEGGKLAEVTVTVINVQAEVIARGSSWGGVTQGSTLGNVYKGSYTNAAKLAFARVGPGHEVYVGAIDLDPDVNEDVAKEQSRTPAVTRDTAVTAPAVEQDDPEKQITALLAIQDDLTVLRKQADDGMQALGASPSQRVRELHAATEQRALEALVTRVSNALTAADTAD